MRTAAFAAAVLVSLVVLFAPSPSGAPTFPHADKAVHVALFAVLAGAAVWRFGRTRAVAVGVVAYAVLSEVAQGVALADRSADPTDVVADLVGAAVAGAAAARGDRHRSGADRALKVRSSPARRPPRSRPGGDPPWR